jgi:hypothetical protein
MNTKFNITIMLNQNHICFCKLWLFAIGLNIEHTFYISNPYRFSKTYKD